MSAPNNHTSPPTKSSGFAGNLSEVAANTESKQPRELDRRQQVAEPAQFIGRQNRFAHLRVGHPRTNPRHQHSIHPQFNPPVPGPE